MVLVTLELDSEDIGQNQSLSVELLGRDIDDNTELSLISCIILKPIILPYSNYHTTLLELFCLKCGKSTTIITMFGKTYRKDESISSWHLRGEKGTIGHNAMFVKLNPKHECEIFLAAFDREVHEFTPA